MNTINSIIDKTDCHNLQYRGEFIGRDEKYIINMLGVFNQHHFYIKRNYVKYKITIKTVVNKKQIDIETDKPVSFYAVYLLLLELLRFENLFDGRFFPATSIMIDNTECLNELSKEMPAYYSSNEAHVIITLNLNDKNYKHLFISWNKLNKKLGIIHQMYLFNTFVRGNPVDIRLSLLLEVFEALAPMLKREGIITIPKYKKTISVTCQNCKRPATKQVTQKPTFHDKLKAIMDVYGEVIFKGDSKAKLLRKAISVRNKVVHVNKKQKGYMNGKSCGFYLYKFALMYRYIIFLHLDINETEFMPTFRQWLKKFNYKFDMCRIKP